MAKMNDRKPKAKETKTEVDNTTDTSSKSLETQTKPKQEGLEAIFNRLDALEKENAELKGEINPEKKAKERYQGPRLFSYKLRGGVPVLNYTGFLKDPTRSDIYRKGDDWISNQYLKLTLADGKSANVEVNEFGKFFERSKQVEAKDSNGTTIVLGMNPESYVFDTEAYGEIIVSNKAIN